jgi:hypothetical protein
MALKITTNKQWREFKQREDVPKKTLSSDFDWLEAEDGFFKYRGVWYHTEQFMMIQRDGISTQHAKRADMGELEKWYGYSADSAFSGVVIRISKDGERYQVGTYIS